jgi:2-C-methyl-D-erythritol 2,4-cyclodiphosphate synthase
VIERPKPQYRSGIGTDIHRLVEGRDLVLGGVLIAHPLGLIGHSDGDVALHAVIDALLGAACMGDIGTFFPDTDDTWKGSDSKGLLLIVKDMLDEQDWEIANVDLIIHAEEPKLGAYKAQIKRCIASLLGIDFTTVNVKAKTNEGLGEIGESLAISATAAVLLMKRYRRTL